MVYKHSKPDWTSSLLNVVNNVVSGSQPVDKPKGGGREFLYEMVTCKKGNNIYET